MTNTLNTKLLAVMLFLGRSQVGYAQDFLKGWEAYERGDLTVFLFNSRVVSKQALKSR